jgi:hypothetical protein
MLSAQCLPLQKEKYDAQSQKENHYDGQAGYTQGGHLATGSHGLMLMTSPLGPFGS